MGTSAVDKAYRWLQQNIAQGNLAAGSFIEEANVVEATGVSRTPVREAFHRLAGERYIDLLPRRGAQVRHFTARDAAEVYDARRAIETFAAREICDKNIALSPQHGDFLNQMDAMEPFDGSPTAAEFLRLDHQFHRSYVAAEGNRLLLQLYDSITPQLERIAARAAHVLTRPNVDLIRGQHWKILNALSERDGDAAVAAIEDHLQPLPGWRGTTD